MQARSGQQVVDVGDPAGDRVLDRDHGEVGGPRPASGGEGVLEGGAGHRLEIRDSSRRRRCASWRLARPDRRSNAVLVMPVPLRRSAERARSRSSGVSTPSGAASTMATSMRMPASSARSCSSRSRRSSGEGGSATKRGERRAAVGVEADVVQKRPFAPRRPGAGEVERAKPARPTAAPTALTTLGSSFSSARMIGAASVAMSTAGSSSGARQARTRSFLDRRQVALNVDDSRRRRRRDRRRRAPRRCGRTRTDGRRGSCTARPPAASTARGPRAGRRSPRPPARASASMRPSPDVHDHRLAADVGERLARQPGRSHARGNENDGLGHEGRADEPGGKAGLYVLPTQRQSG